MNTIFFANLQQLLLEVVAIFGTVENTAAFADGGLELVCNFIDMIDCPALHVAQVIAQCVDAGYVVVGMQTSCRILVNKTGKRVAHDAVLKFFVDFFA